MPILGDRIITYGFKFTSKGFKPTYEKVRAVKESQAPETRAAVKPFLGMIGYVSKFIDNYSILTELLRELTHKVYRF